MTKGKYIRTKEHREIKRQKMIGNKINVGRKRPDLSKYNKKNKPLQIGNKNGRWKKGYLTEGEKNGRWLGGISFIAYPKEFNIELKQLIRKRDKFKCKLCKKSQKQNKRKLDIHHIDYNKHNNKPENLISLCRVCHCQTSNNRNKWKKFFKAK